MNDFRNNSSQQLTQLDDEFNQWLSKAQRLCAEAVFHEEKDIMEFLWRSVLHKMDSVNKVRTTLEKHLQLADKLRKDQLAAKPFSLPEFFNTSKISPAEFPVVSAFPDRPLMENANSNGSLHTGFGPIGFAKPASMPTFFSPSTSGVTKDSSKEYPRLPPGVAAALEKPSLTIHSPVVADAVKMTNISVPPTGRMQATEEDGEWSTVTRKHKIKESKAGGNAEKVEAKMSGKEKETVGEAKESGRSSQSSGEVVDKKKVFLMKLPRELESQFVLANYFEKWGPLVDVKIFRNEDGTPTGCAFVDFKNEASAQTVLSHGLHFVGENRHQVLAKAFYNRDVSPKNRNYQVYLGGVPSFMTKEEVVEAVERKFKVRELKLNAEGGFAFVELLNEADVPKLLALGYIKVGEKMVECKKYRK